MNHDETYLEVILISNGFLDNGDNGNLEKLTDWNKNFMPNDIKYYILLFNDMSTWTT